jgi:hypothetical protein
MRFERVLSYGGCHTLIFAQPKTTNKLDINVPRFKNLTVLPRIFSRANCPHVHFA